MTSLTFSYTLEASCRAKNSGGVYVPFTVSNTFERSISDDHYDYSTALNVSTDANGDEIQDFIKDMVHPHILLECDALTLNSDTYIVDSYTVSSSDTDVIVFFMESEMMNTTEDGTQAVYAYWKQASKPPENPREVTSHATATSISLSWQLGEYEDGFRIYDVDGELLADMDENTTSYVFSNLVTGALYQYRITAYNTAGESTGIWVRARALDEGIIEEPEDAPAYVPPDREGETLPAFQSGVGDGMDLLVKTRKSAASTETFSYKMRVRGTEETNISIYPRREFRYRFRAEKDGAVLAETAWRLDAVDGALPFDKPGAGKQNVYIPMEIEVPPNLEGVSITVELDDPSTYLSFSFDKGVAPSTTYTDDWVTFSSSPQSQESYTLRTPYYGPWIEGKGVYIVSKEQPLGIDDEFLSPYYDSVLSKKTIADWTVLVVTENPNVRLTVTDVPFNFMQEKKFLPIKVRAQVINAAQTPWNPLIHNGYYYMNQAEHFLFSESKVQGKMLVDSGYMPLNFLYGIDAHFSYQIDGEHQLWVDQYQSNFTGTFDHTVVQGGNVTLLNGASAGTYTSPVRQFNSMAESYDFVTWTAETPGDSSIAFYMKDGTNWVAINNGEVPAIALSDKMQYKAELTAGTKQTNTVTEVKDTTQEDFTLGMLQNAGKPALIRNAEVINGGVEIDDLSGVDAVYTSRTFDFTANITAFQELAYMSSLGLGYGGESTVYTATSDTGTDWDTVTWLPLLNVVVADGGTLKGTIQSPTARYLKYQVRLKRSTKESVLTWTTDTDADWTSGTRSNLSVINGSIVLQNVTLPGVYTSGVKRFEENREWLSLAATKTMPPNGGSVVIKTMSSNNPAELASANPNDARWMLVEGTTIASPTAEYIVYRIEITSGLDDGGVLGVSPVVQNVTVKATGAVYYSPRLTSASVKANTYRFDPALPVIHSVEMGGTTTPITKTATHTLSLAAEIPYDGSLHRISDVIETIVNEDLQNVSEDMYGIAYEDITVTSYEIIVNDSYGVSLSSRDKDTASQYDEAETGKGCVYGQTTNIAEQLLYDQVRITVDDKNEALVTPTPEQGCPVIVQDGSGKELRQVSFRDDRGYPTLDFTEIVIMDGRKSFYLSYLDIDPATLVLEYYESSVWKPLTGYTQEDNYIILSAALANGTSVRATYRLLDSFYVDINWDTLTGYAKVAVHSSYINASEENGKDLRINYETNESSAYYTVSSLDLNPLNGTSNAGFLYITSQSESVSSLAIEMTDSPVYGNGKDVIWIRVIAKDQYGNGVAGESVTVTVDKGTLTMLSHVTDDKGYIIGQYEVPLLSEGQEATFTASYGASGIHHEEKLLLRTGKLESRLYLQTSASAIQLQDEVVAIIASLYDDKQQPIANAEVRFTCKEGVLDETVVHTNYYGEAIVLMRCDYVPKYGIVEVLVEAPDQKLSGKTFVRIAGYYLYDEERIARVNHLIDLPDYIKARESLGIYMGTYTPKQVEENDIWIDQGDILWFMTSYSLKDAADPEQIRKNLGINVSEEAPENPQFTDVWIDKNNS